MKLFLLPLVTTLLVFNSAFSANTNSLNSGDWNAPSTWSSGSVPSAGDTITIKNTDTVSISTVINMIGPSTTVIINGVLLFDSLNSQLNIPCGSFLYISLTGSVQTSLVGPTTQALRLCRDNVWVSANGTLSGIFSYGTLLPIELNYFEAVSKERSVLFRWQTLSENNNDYFTIEGSTDGFSWYTIHKENGVGTTQEVQNYVVELPNPDLFMYFRLKQTDIDGKSTYSQIVFVDFQYETTRVYPNPMEGTHFTVELPSANSRLVTILSADGRVVYANHFLGGKKLEITDLHLQSGSFILRIEQNNRILTERITVN